VRPLLATLLLLGTLALLIVPEPGSFLLALLVMVAVFLLGAAKLAIDLIELSALELAADVLVLVAVGVALSQIPLGNALLTEALFVLGLVLLSVPRLVRHMRKW
jgi:hypothetical protein